jgi:hypothetical protein
VDVDVDVDVAVDVDVDDQRHILVSICTTRTSNARPSASKLGLAACRTQQTLRIAAHSIADPRAIA